MKWLMDWLKCRILKEHAEVFVDAKYNPRYVCKYCGCYRPLYNQGPIHRDG